MFWTPFAKPLNELDKQFFIKSVGKPHMKYDEFHELTTGDQFYLINLYGQNHILTSFSKTIFPNLSLFFGLYQNWFCFYLIKMLRFAKLLVFYEIS